MTCFDDYWRGDSQMPRRRSNKNSVPKLPLIVRATVRGRTIAEVSFGDDPTEILPGSVVLVVDPDTVSGPDREATVWDVVKRAKLEPKVTYEYLYQLLWMPK